MCTVVLFRRPGAPWPFVLAANRDELKTRPWRAPARHWPDRPDVVAGLDELAGGSWLGVNDYGMVAAVLNRIGTLGPDEARRSRGELVLEALDHASARDAATALGDLDPEAYRPFNLVVADRLEAYWLRHAGNLPGFGFRDAAGTWREVAPIRLPGQDIARPRGDDGVQCHPIPPGVSMLTAQDLNDPASARIRRYLPRFREARVPDPGADDWEGWIPLLADRESGDGDPRDAMTIVTEGDYGTVCSSLVALSDEGAPRLLFAAGRPDEAPFEPVAI